MNHPILDQIRDLRTELAPGDAAPALVTALADGTAPRPALAELAAQQHRIIASDRRSLLLLATRSADLPVSAWFAALAGARAPRCAPCPASPPPAASARTNSPPGHHWPAARPTRPTSPGSPGSH
ncbi:hypothetical protein [Kitasatospora sp. NPDC087271]|uniref:hypothetical protein n=1 Tax=Kitasatospora sp. NPDC087271 TaxID=3364067 RepID=UPI00382B75AC